MIAWNNTGDNFQRKLEKIYFKLLKKMGNTGEISSSVSFHQYIQELRNVASLEIIFF